jgi:hypothetical protein
MVIGLQVRNGRKKKICCYCGKLGHIQKVCWPKTKDLEEKVKKFEGDISTRRSTNLQHQTSKGKANNYTFFVSASQALHAHTSK